MQNQASILPVNQVIQETKSNRISKKPIQKSATPIYQKMNQLIKVITPSIFNIDLNFKLDDDFNEKMMNDLWR